MKHSDEFEKLLLADLEILSEEALLHFEAYSIFTLGQLLGATKGFSNTDLFLELDPSGELLAGLKELVPDKVIEIYRSYSKVYPTGLIKKMDHEKEKEQE